MNQKGRNPRSVKTHCPQGHAYEGYNLKKYRGSRFCRQCGVNASEKFLSKKRAIQ
jgi:hypothetical protein